MKDGEGHGSAARVNDVVLAVVAGAVRRFLGGAARGRWARFRAMVPVNIRADDEQRRLGNRVAMLVVRLPVDEPDPRARLARVSARRQRSSAPTRRRRRAIEELSDQPFPALVIGPRRLARVAAASTWW